MIMLRIIKWLVLAIVLVLLLAAGTSYWILDTPGGMRFALQQVNTRVHAVHIDYQSLDGDFLGPFSFRGLHVHTADLDLRADQVTLDWAPQALWHRQLLVHRLAGGTVEVVTRPQNQSQTPSVPPLIPELPISIVVEQSTLGVLKIGTAEIDSKPLEIRGLALVASWIGNAAEVKHLAATLDETGPLEASARAQLKSDRIVFDSLNFGGPGVVSAKGTLGLGTAPSDLMLDFHDLHWPLLAPEKERQLDAAIGTAHLTGLLDHYDYALELAATVNGIAAQLESNGRGSLQNLQFDKLNLAAAGGSLDGHGNLAWAPQLRADLDAQIAKLDPALFAPELKGDLNGQIHAHTEMLKGQPLVNFTAQLANSTLRGYPLALDTAGTVNGHTVKLASLKLSSGRSILTGRGQVTPPFDVAGHFESPDFSALYPGLGGAGKFDFTLKGALDAPHLVTNGEAGGLNVKRRAAQYRVAKLDWDADVDLDPKVTADSHVDLVASGIDAGIIIPTLSLKASGKEVYHSLLLSAQTERGDLSIDLQGGYDRKRREWGGELHSGSLTPKPLAALTLEKPAGLLLGQKRYSLEPACFVGAAGHACADLVHNVFGETTRIQWNLDQVQLAALKAFFPNDDKVEGRIDGQGDLSLANGDITAAHANLTITGAKFSTSGVPPIEFLPSHVVLEQDKGRLQADIDVHFPQGSLTGEVAAAPAATLNERPLSGKVSLDVPDLAVIEPFLTEAKAVAGKLDGSFEFGGTIGQPRFTGRLALADGRARLVTPGIDLNAVNFSASSDGGPFMLNGSAKSGDGNLEFAGALDLFALPPRADLTLKGENFQAMNTVQAKVWVTPDLHLLRDESGVHLTGDFTVPHAEITPQGFGKGGVAPSTDQVIVGAPPPEQKTGIPIFSDVNLTLGDAVHIDGFGLKTRIEGSIHIHEEPKHDTTGQGELRLIDGSYQAYGQDLTIENGRLIFSGGSILQPAVDIYAVRRPADNITVGVKVRGTLDQPELVLTSDPTMPREQQLSWLVLGRSLDSSSTQDRSLISAAAMSLGLSGGDYFANKVGKKIGIDQISIGSAPAFSSDVAADPNFAASQGIQTANNTGTTAAQQSAQLTLGKYLTPKLFVSYGVSLFDSGYVFRLIYDLGHGFKLQGESGTDNGGDIVYTVERGH